MKLLANKRVSHTLGSTFRKKADAEVFTLGDTHITREMLGELARPFPSVLCCKRLQDVCNQHDIGTLKSLFDYGPDQLASLTGVGEMTLWVAMSLLDHAGYSVPEWFEWKSDGEVVTWQTKKNRAEREKAAAKKPKRKNGAS